MSDLITGARYRAALSLAALVICLSGCATPTENALLGLAVAYDTWSSNP